MYQYHDNDISFTSTEATKLRTIYFPLCGTDGANIKSSITPFLSGDIKIDKLHYITKPASTEDLRNDLRNFFVNVKDHGIFSLAQATENDNAYVEAGPLWHKLVRTHQSIGLEMSAFNFVPVSGDDVELMRVTLKNNGDQTLTLTPVSCVPLFARALANKHDHEHVTSLLHRFISVEQGVVVQPCMSFNEEGHQNNDRIYYVCGVDESGQPPLGVYPTIQSFYGDMGRAHDPQALVEHWPIPTLTDAELQGKEAIGALRFEDIVLSPGDQKEYIIVIGTATNQQKAEASFVAFDGIKQFDQALKANKEYWHSKAFSIEFKSGDTAFNAWMQWVTIQPVLRRIYGCSFLPDHDYGKGGKGWRDIWQDLLSLILIEPNDVRQVLINNFGGVRIDGSNATIIGTKPGEFLADRNAITRVWMDHGVWPLKTILLYVHQSGDFDILLENEIYFRDLQLSRTFEKDKTWTPTYGNQLKTVNGDVYQGSILEHILVQNLVQFFNVGEHNNIRLESADWNDGLDMAYERGESVTFSACYAGNLFDIASLLEKTAEVKGISTISIAREMAILLDTLGDAVDYNSVEAKKSLLFKKYFAAVQPEISGDTVELNISDVARDLRKKGQWMFDHIRMQEKVTVGKNTWFNGYYDNKAKRVEGKVDENVWMTLTGQVFPVMSGLANEEEISQVVKSSNKYLKDQTLGGYRLNSDFGLKHYLDLGRAFGFAYGTKENGAFFSHMIVMYAYALYKRGFARDGHVVLDSIYKMCMDTERSKIYPGLPEYFDSNGRGMYHYLTGSASWMVLTELTQVFGVRGEYGDLCLAPNLVKEQFNDDGHASTSCHFAGKTIHVNYINETFKDAGKYRVKSVKVNGLDVNLTSVEEGVVISRDVLGQTDNEVTIEAVLS